MKTKVCKACDQEKSILQFSDKRKKGDHGRAQCKACHDPLLKERMRLLNGKRRNDAFRAARRKYMAELPISEARRARERRHAKEYAERYPDKKAAHGIVKRAILAGKLRRQNVCEQCGGSPVRRDGVSAVHAHHDDYSRPLDVRWLCHICHNLWHRSIALPLAEEDKQK